VANAEAWSAKSSSSRRPRRGRQNRPFPRFPLTDEQWRETAKLSGIPEGNDDARHEIETRIGMFRESQASDLDRVTAATIRQELEALAVAAGDLRDRLSKLVEVPNAYTALTMQLDGQRRLSQTLDTLFGLPKWLQVAKYAVKTDKRGPKAGNVYWLVGNLDGIREQFTGKTITRSYKDDGSKKYITYVCRIAHPHIGGGTIERAMKDRIKRRRVD